MQGTSKGAVTQEIFAGIDLHKRTWHVTMTDEGGGTIYRGSMPADPHNLLKLFERYRGQRITAGYEAGYFGYWLHDMLEEAGISCVVIPPSLIPGAYGNRVKTDARDSAKLAELLVTKKNVKVVVPSPDERHHRQVIRTRRQLIRKRIQAQHQIRAFLMMYGIVLPPAMTAWTKAFVMHLHRMKLKNPYLHESFQNLLMAYDDADRLVVKQTGLLRKLAKEDKYRDRVAILTSIPGIGVISAMEMLLELQDVGRFSRADQLAAYVGLTPSQYSSGAHIRMGHITGIGKASLRTMLIEAAWVLVRKDEEWSRKYAGLRYRTGSKRAIVAIARRLLLMSRRLLLDNRTFESRSAA